jgi:hypothetical protein
LVNTSYFVDVLIEGGNCKNVSGDFISGNWRSHDQTTTIDRLQMIGDFVGDGASRIATTSKNPSTATGVRNTRRIALDTLPSDGIQNDRVILTMPTLGRGSEYIATVASASGSAVYRMISQAGVSKDVTGSRPAPTASDVGLMYLDTTLDADGKPIWWNGAAWLDATGATV